MKTIGSESFERLKAMDPRRRELQNLASELIAKMVSAGDFGNSFRKWNLAHSFMDEAISAHLALEDGFVGSGGFLLSEIAEKEWALAMEIVSNMDVPYQRSILKGSALNALNTLRKRGAIEKHGITYKLGDLRNVLAEIR